MGISISRLVGRRAGRAIFAGTALGLTLAMTMVGATFAPASASRIVAFTDPHGEVGCQIAAADDVTPYDRVRCDLVTGDVPAPLPPEPSSCQAEWGTVVRMDENDLQFPQWGACVGDSGAYGAARAAGTIVEVGDFRCKVLDQGATCRNTQSHYGFVLTPTTLRFVRPTAKAVLSPSGIGKLHLGMTKRQAQRTGYLGQSVCSAPQLKSSLHMNAWLTWHNRRLSEVLANSYTNTQATKRVGVGSSVRQVRSKYRGRMIATTDRVEGTRAYVYQVSNRVGLMVFLLQTPNGQAPSATTPVNGIWVTRSWDPKQGYAFDGC